MFELFVSILPSTIGLTHAIHTAQFSHSYGLGFTLWATRFPEVRGVGRTSNPKSLPHAYRSRVVEVISSATPPSVLIYHHTNTNSQAFIPGRFDLAFSSHNLWHLSILIAVWTWYNGLIEYSEALHSLGCHYLDEPPPK